MKIEPLQNTWETFSDAPVQKERILSEPESGFGRFLKESIQEINDLQNGANQAIEDLAAGKRKDVHSAMIAMEKASVSFELMMQVRNKIVSAYETIMRMPV